MAEVSVSDIADVIQAVAVVIATGVGVHSINVWRRQLIGGKKVQLAEETLVAVADMLELIANVRNVGQFPTEGRSRTRGPHESEEDSRVLDAYYTPVERLKSAKAVEVTNRLDKLRGLCRIYFGEQAVSEFNTLTASQHRIDKAARWLIYTYGEPRPLSPDLREKQQTRESELDAIIHDYGSQDAPDPFMARLIGAADALEAILRPHLDDAAPTSFVTRIALRLKSKWFGRPLRQRKGAERVP